MPDRPKRIKAPEGPAPARVVADAIDRVTEAIREAFGPRVEMKVVHDEFPALKDAIHHIKLNPGDAERFGGHEETLLAREDLAKIAPFYETEGQRLKRLLAEIRARVLILSGYREEDNPSTGDVAQNELAVERTDTVMAFFDLAQGHPLPRKLLPRGDRVGDWLPPGTEVTVLGRRAVVVPEEERVLVQMEGVSRPVSFPRTAIAKEGEPWTPLKPTE